MGLTAYAVDRMFWQAFAALLGMCVAILPNRDYGERKSEGDRRERKGFSD